MYHVRKELKGHMRKSQKQGKAFLGICCLCRKNLAQGRCQCRVRAFNRVAGSAAHRPVESTPLARDPVCQSKKVLGEGLGKSRGLGPEPCVWIRFKSEV